MKALKGSTDIQAFVILKIKRSLCVAFPVKVYYKTIEGT